jgi:hypothetical protein
VELAIIKYPRGHKGKRLWNFTPRGPCFYCGGMTFYMTPTVQEWAYTKDHVFPRRLRFNGNGLSSRTVTACWRCNSLKGEKRPGDFIRDHIVPQRWPLIDWQRITEAYGAEDWNVGWAWPRSQLQYQDEISSTILSLTSA